MRELFLRYIGRLWRGVLWLFGAAREPRQINPVVYQIVSFVLVLIVGLVLGWFTPRLPLADDLGFEWDFVNRYFWGVVWFLLYIFVRLVIYVIELFRMEEASDFEDIDHAWLTGLRAIASRGLDLHNVPLFLITGLKNVAEETSFLTGAGFHHEAIGPEIDQPAALRVYANQEAILVMATGVSMTSAQVNAAPGAVLSAVGGGGGVVGAMDSSETLKPGQGGLMDAPAEAGFGDAFGDVSGETLNPAKAAQAQASSTQSVTPLGDGQRQLCEARLSHLARIMARDRYPLCPINGLVACVPMSWTQTSRPELYQSVQSDVAQLSWTMGLQFPVVCLGTGLEGLGSLNDLLSRCRQADPRFSPGTRAGARFSTGQPLSNQNAQWASGRSLAWFQNWVYACFAADCTTKGSRTNGQLYRLWCSLSASRAALATMLVTGFGSSGSVAPVRLTGCYFSGFANRQMVFVRDVLGRLVGAQDQVAWTPERIAKDAGQRFWASVIWGVVLGLAALNAFLIYHGWFR